MEKGAEGEVTKGGEDEGFKAGPLPMILCLIGGIMWLFWLVWLLIRFTEVV